MMTRQERKCALLKPPPPTKFEDMKVEIVGDSPLLVQRIPHAMVFRPRPPLSPKEQFETARHRIKRGGKLVDGFPVIDIKTAMASVGFLYFGLPGKASTMAAVFIRAAGTGRKLTEIKFKGRKPIAYRTVVRLPGYAVPHLCIYRPRYNKWSMKLVICYDANVITSRSVVHLLNIVGHATGIGEWRLAYGGQFGMFHVKGTKGIPRKRKASRKAS